MDKVQGEEKVEQEIISETQITPSEESKEVKVTSSDHKVESPTTVDGEECAQTEAQEQQQKLPANVQAASTHQEKVETQTHELTSNSSPFNALSVHA